ncbi:DUF429 domain-containing protein [Labrys okinawensis]|uniref:DUF429 domain-containing protein n=1 Tax=Labrys okinawensis TaxID=346911 RepID=UPI0039BD1256
MSKYQPNNGMRMYYGIDFSGAADPWKARCLRPTVWVATIVGALAPRLSDIRPVQELPGEGAPFTRLVDLLRAGDFSAAGIDAPFAIPGKFLPTGGHAELLDRVNRLPAMSDRPFPSGAALLELAKEIAPSDEKKPHRETERFWVKRGVNTRSTLWNGPRGGAAFTAACLTLLARARRPIWPWDFGPGMLVEAFPAAQLRTWALPHSGYGKPEQQATREKILIGLARHLNFTDAQGRLMLGSPDALDAVLAGFAAMAAMSEGTPTEYPIDGLIAVRNDGELGSSLSEPAMPDNLLRAEGSHGKDELFEEVLHRPGVQIERIVSRGHTTPADKPYVQSWDEWVLVLAGSARLKLDGSPECSLVAGEHLLIPAGVPHLVTYTSDPTIWLAVHIGKA